MKIGITGAGGMLGRTLVDRFAESSGIEVVALSRRPAMSAATPNVRWLQGDLASSEDCNLFVAGLDVVFHCAHKNSPLTSDGEWARDAQLNLVPTLNLLSAIERSGRRMHVVYPSSGGAVYGASQGLRPFRETDPCLPLNSYGIQKLAIEHYLRVFAQRDLLTVSVLRIGNAYGWLLPPDRTQGFIGTAINRMLHGQPVRIIGDTHNVRDYVHIEDIATAVMSAAARREPFEVFNIGTGAGSSVADILAVLEQLTGRQPITEIVQLPGADRLPPWCVLDISEAERCLGWRPQVALADGLARMLDTVPVDV